MTWFQIYIYCLIDTRLTSSHSQLTPKINQIITLHNFNQSCNVVRGKIKSRRCYLIKQRALQRCSHTNLQETNTLPSDKKKTKGTRQTKGYLSWRQHSETENCDYKVHHPNLESLNWDMKLFFWSYVYSQKFDVAHPEALVWLWSTLPLISAGYIVECQPREPGDSEKHLPQSTALHNPLPYASCSSSQNWPWNLSFRTGYLLHRC